MRKYKKTKFIMRLACVFALVCFLVGLASPPVLAAPAGDAISWRFSGGTLTISGSGAMTDFTENDLAPWHGIRESIRVVNIESGVTAVGRLAFWGCTNLTSVNMASTVKTIGYYAFYECSNLKILNLSTGLTTIGEGAFERCSSLQSVRFPSTLKTIARRAFYRCSALQVVTIPSSVTTIGSQAFAYCDKLVTATVNANVEELPPRLFYSCSELAKVNVSENTVSSGDDAFSFCDKLTAVNYEGSEHKGSSFFEDIKDSAPNLSDTNVQYNTPADKTAVSFNQSKVENNTLIQENTTVKETDNALVSTTVKNESEINGNNQQVNVSIDASLENPAGWSELVEQIENSERVNLLDKTIDVNVNLNTDQKITSETLGGLVGKNVDLVVEMNDGSSVTIDCSQLNKDVGTGKTQEYILSHTISVNEAPTSSQIKTIGEAESYLLSFAGSSNFEFSPKIYIGKDKADSVATLYQEAALMGVKKLQSVVVDRDGYASFYLSSTRDTTKYIIALNVSDVKKTDAIISTPNSGSANRVESYVPVEYVSTGVRLFMGLNIFQFSLVIFGSALLLFLLVAGFMYPVYRKKRLEAIYQMKYGK